MEMKINEELLRQIESDLSLDTPFVKGKKYPIKNCWHFCTDGNAVESLFCDEQDFRDGMNRVFVVWKKYNIIILAFCLMDTHVHFILYGNFEECNQFIHKYVQLTSRHIYFRHNERKKLWRLPISHQFIDNDYYLKTAICYVIKNAPVAGLPFNALEYPWSGNALYFKRKGYWTSPQWKNPDNEQEPPLKKQTISSMTIREQHSILKSKQKVNDDVMIMSGIVFPGEYVAWEIVERIFKTHKSFNWFMCISKDEDIEKQGGSISHLSIPMQELRQYRNAICSETFGANTIRTLSITDRLKLARILHARYNCSLKQIARLCGLIYDEVKKII